MDIVLGSAALSLPAVDVSVLSRASRVEALVQLQRARAWVDSSEQRLLAAVGEPGGVPSGRRVSAAVAAKQYVRAEIACALQVSPLTVNDKLHTARMLVGELPSMLAAVETGEVSMRHAPVPAEVARRMAGDASGTWRRLVTDPMGHLVDYGRSKYRPPQDLTDHVIARDRRCRFPGCGRQARPANLITCWTGTAVGSPTTTTCCPAARGTTTCATTPGGR